MADKPVDYGVQIRFINDLREPRRPPRPPRGKGGTYGVAVRVQGIAGQPFVVLNSGDKGGDSFGVQIKSDAPFPTPPGPPGSGGSDSELPENPYGGRRPRRGSGGSEEGEIPGASRGVPKFSDEEIPGGSRRVPKSSVTAEEPGGSRRIPKSSGEELLSVPKPSAAAEELRRSQSHGDLPGATAASPSGIPRAQSGKNFGKRDEEATKEPGDAGDVDTEPLSSVDSLISKFDGNLPRGRAARRSRGPAASQRKRSQSLDAPKSRESSGARPQIPTGSDAGLRGRRGFGGAEQQSVELQVFGGKSYKIPIEFGVFL